MLPGAFQGVFYQVVVEYVFSVVFCVASVEGNNSFGRPAYSLPLSRFRIMC